MFCKAKEAWKIKAKRPKKLDDNQENRKIFCLVLVVRKASDKTNGFYKSKLRLGLALEKKGSKFRLPVPKRQNVSGTKKHMLITQKYQSVCLFVFCLFVLNSSAYHVSLCCHRFSLRCFAVVYCDWLVAKATKTSLA